MARYFAYLCLMGLATVMAFSLQAAESHKCQQADLLPTAEDYEVLKAFLAHEQNETKKPLVVIKTTGMPNHGWVPQKEVKPADQATNDAIRRAGIRVDMAPFGDVDNEFMTSAEFKSLTKHNFPSGALEAYPKHFGVYRLGLPGYSRDGKYARLIVEVYCGDSGDGFFDFVKKSGKWVYAGGYYIW